MKAVPEPLKVVPPDIVGAMRVRRAAQTDAELTPRYGIGCNTRRKVPAGDGFHRSVAERRAQRLCATSLEGAQRNTRD